MTRFENFQELNPDDQRLVLDWLDKARDSIARQRGVFEAFIFLWISFNSWMAAVTGEESDVEMVRMLGKDSSLTRAFSNLKAQSQSFNENLDAFAFLWPIFNVSDIRVRAPQFLHYRTFKQRSELVRHLERYPNTKIGIRRRPKNWVSGTIPQWPNLLDAIYQVRCNLFHGNKALNNEIDRRFITLAFQLLEEFIRASGCYGWYNTPAM